MMAFAEALSASADAARAWAEQIGKRLLPALQDVISSWRAFGHELHAGYFEAYSPWRRIVHQMAIGAYLAHNGEWWQQR